jgi:hypothetical protein
MEGGHPDGRPPFASGRHLPSAWASSISSEGSLGEQSECTIKVLGTRVDTS